MSGTAESPAQIEYDPKIISDIIQGSLTDKGRATKLLQELYKYFGETGLSTLPSFWRDENGNLSLQQLQKSLQEQMNYVQ